MQWFNSAMTSCKWVTKAKHLTNLKLYIYTVYNTPGERLLVLECILSTVISKAATTLSLI